MEKIRYIEQLAERYPTVDKAATEIINLQSILNLPKGTEHFVSDIHGEYEAFSHVLRNGSGAVRKKIDDVFGHKLSNADKSALATLIYYPQEKMELVKQQEKDMSDWYRITLYRLIEICKVVSSKYTRSKVRKALPEDYAYIIEELITEKPEIINKEAYYEAIINSIIDLDSAEQFIIAMAELVQQLVINHLHIIGDVYDRGPGAHLIMDRLCKYHSVDIQWGNHDVLWMGASLGHKACIASAIRNSIRYGNLDFLEDGYGINLLPLATFAIRTYGDDPCECFVTKLKSDENERDKLLTKKMHKAIFVIKLKLEAQIAQRHPEYRLGDRMLLGRIDYENGSIDIEGKQYKLNDIDFPTVNKEDPFKLTEEEEELMERLQRSFMNCEKLQRHMNFMVRQGGMYCVYNGNLLFHGCIPMNDDGSFTEVEIEGKKYAGKALYDVLEAEVKKIFNSTGDLEGEEKYDLLWYLWNAPDSPLYGRKKVATFERYFIDDKDVQKEYKNPYYRHIENEETADRILDDFGLKGREESHIINGHVPVRRIAGEKPVKSNGKVIVIDGGFSKTYRRRTGIAGYTLIYNSYGLTLTAHEPFVSKERAIIEEIDIVSNREAVQYTEHRILVGDTDEGEKIKGKIQDLKELINAYRTGKIEI